MKNSSEPYTVSNTEIKRRICAFTSLLISFLLVFGASSFLVLPGILAENYTFFYTIGIVMILVTLISQILTVKFFRSYVKTEYRINEDILERKTMQSHDSFSLMSLVKISVKRTSRNTIREIGLWFDNGTNIFIDGVEQFEDLLKKITGITPHIKPVTYREPFDFDHELFYPLLGLTLGVMTSLFIKFAVSFTDRQLKFVHIAFNVYIFSLGCYFLVSKPLTKRYGDKLQKADMISGIAAMFYALLFLALNMFP